MTEIEHYEHHPYLDAVFLAEHCAAAIDDALQYVNDWAVVHDPLWSWFHVLRDQLGHVANGLRANPSIPAPIDPSKPLTWAARANLENVDDQAVDLIAEAEKMYPTAGIWADHQREKYPDS